MAKYKVTGKGENSESIAELISGLYNLQSQFPEINRAAAAEIAKRAVVLAKEYIREGGAPEKKFEPLSKDTPEITMRLRGVDRNNGKPPLNENGDLHDSIRVVMNTVSFGKIYVAIGSDEVYAAIQEYGGDAGGAIDAVIPPRPYLRPAILNAIYESAGGSLERRIAQAYELAIKKKKWKHLFN